MITEIYYNWFQSGDSESGFGDDWERATVGKETVFNHENKLVTEIVEHLPKGEGDRLWYDIVYEDGSIDRIFNPNRIIISND